LAGIETAASFDAENHDSHFLMKPFCTFLLSLSLLAAPEAAEKQIVLPGLPFTEMNAELLPDLELACKGIGITYQKLEHGALKGDSDALAAMIALRFEGSAAELLGEIKSTLLLRVPPDETREALRTLSAKVRGELIAAMREKFVSWNGGTEEVKAAFQERYKFILE
jgi:hypothetical protein